MKFQLQCEFLVIFCVMEIKVLVFFFSFFFFPLTANAGSVHTFEEILCKYLKCQEWNLKTIPLCYSSSCFISGKSIVCGHLKESVSYWIGATGLLRRGLLTVTTTLSPRQTLALKSCLIPLGVRAFLQRYDEEFAIMRQWAVTQHWKHDTGVRPCGSQDMGASHSHVIVFGGQREQNWFSQLHHNNLTKALKKDSNQVWRKFTLQWSLWKLDCFKSKASAAKKSC